MSARPRPPLRGPQRGVLAALAAALVALQPVPAGALPLRDPIQVRIEGYIDAT